MSARVLMIQGTGSSVGKSLLVTALCRIFARRGVSVAPFKSQNMSLNSFITAEGLEMGRAQVAQAEAAGLAPSALMNPVLLKPSGDRTSQVIVNGRVRACMDAAAYHLFRGTLADEVLAAYTTLAARHDLILIEGAGSPAEINLRENDIANMGMAVLADAPVLLVGDIDRGGVFAALYGTVALLPPAEQRRIRGCVINKFRGDPAILEPGLRQLEALLHIPVLGVLPYLDVRLDEEDSLSERLRPGNHTGRINEAAAAPVAGVAGAADAGAFLDIVVIRLPRLSNFTDFAVFDTQPDVRLRYVGDAEHLGRPDLIILPGTKNTLPDMRFLKDSGLAGAILHLHGQGTPLIGICGGFQMLGRAIRDPLQVESDCGETAGLGLLDLDTVFAAHKHTVQTTLRVREDAAKGMLRGTGGMCLEGYEIHMGRSVPASASRSVPFGRNPAGQCDGLVNPSGTVFGVYLHGVFDSLPFTRTLLNNLRQSRGLHPLPLPTEQDRKRYAQVREAEYDRLADQVESCLDIPALERIMDQNEV